MTADRNSVIEDFRAAMRTAGIEYGGEIQTGKLTRFNAVGERGQASWYVLFLDGIIPAGKFGCHRRDLEVPYKFKNGANDYTKEQWAEAAKKIKEAEAAKKTDAEKRLTEAKATAQRLLSAGVIPDREHEYLKRKKVGMYGEIRQDEEACLLLPLRDIEGVLYSMQLIAPDKRFGYGPDNKRDKDFIPGGKIQGCFYTVSDLTEGPLVICEGYATGASVFEATGYATVCAMSCGNLLEIAKAFREKYPQRPIIMAADNDRNTKGNPGLTKAQEAAKAINAAVAIPIFAAVDDPKASDFNDYFTRYGTDGTARLINTALAGLYNAVGNKGLPPLDNAAGMMGDTTIRIPPEVIKGLLHQGLKGVLGSSSKARKSWLLLDAAISVATGTDFWKWQTVQGRVLYINFEIPRAFIRSRIAAVMRAKEVSSLTNMDVWTLRGFAGSLERLLPEIMKQVRNGNYVLIVIDPIYKTLGDRDENAAGDVASLCNEIEKLAVESNAAVIYAAHFSKGNQAAKEAIDRIGGSGVWTRDADTIVVLTKHKEPDCFTVDMILRNLPEAKPFVVKWDFPLMRPTEFDPEDLKMAKPSGDSGKGRPPSYSAGDLFTLIPADRWIFNADWVKAAYSEFGISRSQFFRLRKELEDRKKITKDKNGNWIRAEEEAAPSSAPADTEPTTEELFSGTETNQTTNENENNQSTGDDSVNPDAV